MKPCLETIRIENRRPCRVEYHNQRLNRTRQALLGSEDELLLEDFLEIPPRLGSGVYKCRVVYATTILRVEFEPYQIRPIRSIRLIADNEFDYCYKWLDRSRFAWHLNRADADDVLIVKNGYLTDTSYANIALFDGEQWRTPAQPLLAGTRRQELLEAGLLTADLLRLEDLRHFRQLKLLNAMLRWEESPIIAISALLPGEGLENRILSK